MCGNFQVYLCNFDQSFSVGSCVPRAVKVPSLDIVLKLEQSKDSMKMALFTLLLLFSFKNIFSFVGKLKVT